MVTILVICFVILTIRVRRENQMRNVLSTESIDCRLLISFYEDYLGEGFEPLSGRIVFESGRHLDLPDKANDYLSRRARSIHSDRTYRLEFLELDGVQRVAAWAAGPNGTFDAEPQIFSLPKGDFESALELHRYDPTNGASASGDIFFVRYVDLNQERLGIWQRLFPRE